MTFEAKMTQTRAGRTRTARVWSTGGTFQVLCEVNGKCYETRDLADLGSALTAARTWVDAR